MKRIIIAILCCFPIVCSAQNNLGKTDDVGGIIMTPFVATNTNVPEYAQAALINKLQQAVTVNGLGGDTYDQRFAITINMIELSKDVTSTVPTQYIVNVEPTVYIGDLSTGALFSSVSLGEIKGIGKSDNLAYIAAIKKINAKSPQLLSAIEKGKAKIIEYYNSQIDFLLANAKALTASEVFDEAIFLLMGVPSVCKDAYMKAMDAVGGIYQKKIDKESAQALARAKAIWSATLSYDGAMEAAEWLAEVHPNSSSAPEARRLSTQIARRVKEIDQREWDFVLKEQSNSHEQTMAEINALREIGVAQANRPIYNYEVLWW